jgi:hypothetical protein
MEKLFYYRKMLLFRDAQLYKKIHDECLHSRMYFLIKLFGGYATQCFRGLALNGNEKIFNVN